MQWEYRNVYFPNAERDPGYQFLSPCKMELEGSTVQVNEVAYMIGLSHPRGLLLSCNGSTAWYTSFVIEWYSGR